MRALLAFIVLLLVAQCHPASAAVKNPGGKAGKRGSKKSSRPSPPPPTRVGLSSGLSSGLSARSGAVPVFKDPNPTDEDKDAGPHPTVQPRAAGDRPNIVVILTDDQDYLLNSTHRAYMPKLDKHIASKGLHLPQFIVTTSLCCPSRVNLLTGKFTHNTNVTSNYEPHGEWSVKGWLVCLDGRQTNDPCDPTQMRCESSLRATQPWHCTPLSGNLGT